MTSSGTHAVVGSVAHSRRRQGGEPDEHLCERRIAERGAIVAEAPAMRNAFAPGDRLDTVATTHGRARAPPSQKPHDTRH